jgi:hypothetical protein
VFNFLKKNVIFSVALSIGFLTVPMFFVCAETLTVTPEIVIPSEPTAVVVMPKISPRSENKNPNTFVENSIATVKVLSAIFTDGFAVIGNDVRMGMYGSSVTYSNAFSNTKKFVEQTEISIPTETFGNVASAVMSFFSTGVTFGNVSYVAKNVSEHFPNVAEIMFVGATGIIDIYREGFVSVGHSVAGGSLPKIGVSRFTQKISLFFVDGFVVVGKNVGEGMYGSVALYENAFSSINKNFGNYANVFSGTKVLTDNFSNNFSQGFAVIVDNVAEGMFMSAKVYKNAFRQLASVTKNVPNVNQIEIIGAQNLLAVFIEGFAVVGDDVKTGMMSSVLAYEGLYNSMSALDFKSHFSAVAVATPSAWDSFWCGIKGWFGFSCPVDTSHIAITVAPKVVTPPVKKVVTPSVPVVAVSPTPSPVVSQNKVLSYSSILASLKNIFAPISLTDILGARITALEKKGSAGGASSNEILALQNQINAINASRFFSPSYSYTPTAMIGGNGQAVVFNTSAPNGVFENGVTASSGTYSSGVTAGSLSTGGTLSVTGATTLSGAFNGGNTLYIDAVNSRVGIGTSTPSDTLSLNGPLYFAQITPSATVNRLYNNGGDLYWAGSLIGGATTGNWATDGTHAWRATGNIGIGTTSPYAKLSVAGQVAAEYFSATSTTATSTLAGGLSVAGSAGLTVLQNGNVGVGTASPSYLFDIESSLVTGTVQEITNTSTGGKRWNIISTGASNTGGAGNLYFFERESGVGSLFLKSNGNVGIGTTTPGQKLSVAGDILGNNFIASYFTATTSTATSTLAGGLSVAGTAGLTVLQNGNVGIGTAVPGAKLEVEGKTRFGNLADASSATNGVIVYTGNTASANTGIDLIRGTSWTTASSLFGMHLLSNSGGSYRGGLGFTNSSSFSEQMTFNSSGNIGIGTTSPYSKLSVWGTSTGTNQLFELTNSASTTLASFLENGTGYFLGNIGIGTTSPYAKLSVVGQVVADYFSATSTTATSTFAGNINVDSGALTYTQSSGIVDVATLTSGQESFETNAGIASWMDLPVDSTPELGTIESYIAQIDSNALMTMYSESLGDGNVWKMGVGIGTTTPTLAMFQIQSATSTTGTTDLVDVSDISGNSYFRIKQSGKIGIGTTSPYAKLSVWSSGTGTGQAFEITNNASTTIAKFLDNGTAYFQGNVGIGTTTPGQKLSVAGDILGNNFIASYFTATTSTATSTLAGGLSVAGTSGLTVLQNGNIGVGTASPLRKFQITNAGANAQLMLEDTGASANQHYGSLGFARGAFSFNTMTDALASTTRMVINSSGNVGIGTTTPYSKLSVWGTSTGTNRMFELTNSASTTLASFLENGTGYFLGNIGIGTTSPYAKLSVVGQVVADYFSATSTTATSTFAGNINVDSGALTYTQSSGIVDIAALSMGAQSFESDAGILSWTDMPVTSTSALGTVNSYSAQMDTNPMLTLYSESLGDGNTWKNAVGIGTTTPLATLSIQSATSTTGTTPIFDIAGLTGTSFMRMTAAGALSVYGTTTLGVAGQMAGLQIGNGGICVDNDGSCTASTTGRISSITSTVGATDVAENYSSTEALEPGDIVATRGKAEVGKANSESDVILGIVSTDPGVLLGFSLDPATTTTTKLFPVALSGRVPVKVSNKNGEIKVGDRLSLSSDEAGIAVKATKDGQTVGIALEDWNESGTGKILTFVSLSWYQTLADAVSGDVPASKTFFEQIVDAVKDQIVTFTEKIIALKGMIIGSPEKPAGITIYDENTKEPFCVKVRDGVMVTEPGECVVSPTCVSPQILNDAKTECVDPPLPLAEEPTCSDTQTLSDGQCVDNPPAESTCDLTANTMVGDVCTPCDLSANTIESGVCTLKPESPPTCTEGQTPDVDACVAPST